MSNRLKLDHGGESGGHTGRIIFPLLDACESSLWDTAEVIAFRQAYITGRRTTRSFRPLQVDGVSISSIDYGGPASLDVILGAVSEEQFKASVNSARRIFGVARTLLVRPVLPGPECQPPVRAP